MEEICPICKRPFGKEMQDHPLKPKTFKSRDKSVHNDDNKVTIHKMCHQKIHATFSEQDLWSYYHTVDRLLEHEDIQKFVKWVKKKEPDFYDKNDQTQERKRKRKY